MNEIAENELTELIELNDKFKNAYFWSPPKNASGRRYYEKQNSMAIKGTFKGYELDLSFVVDCSCKNIYVSRKYVVDGKKTTITKIKNMVKK